MIVTITKGRSLGGLGMYLLHDKREGEAGPHPETAERVTWTHTLNLAEDDPHEALREMIGTAQAQPMLRRMAGQAKAGRPTKDSAYHVALSWEPSERPDKAHMIEAAESFLRHMGHAEFQCLMVAHEPDASGRLHLHLELCRIHPLTGATMSNPRNDYARAQAWAERYQQERGQTFCAERTKRAAGQPHRDLHMPRWQWEQWKKTDLTREAFLDQQRGHAQAQAQMKDQRGQRWDSLKAAQRAEREQFFSDTKAAMKGLRAEVWLAVKAETAPRWQGYARQREQMERERQGYRRALTVKLRQAGYRDWAGQLRRAERQHAAELRAGLTTLRRDIQAEQSARFAQVNDRAWQNLQQARQEAYRGLLARQQSERHQMHAAQRVTVPPVAAATPAQLAEARARAIVEALRAARPDLARAGKTSPNAAPKPDLMPQAEATRSFGTVKHQPRSPTQGSKPMLDEEQKRKKPAAPSFFATARAAFPNPLDTTTFSIPPMPNEAAARAKSQRDHEQYLRDHHQTQVEKGYAPDPHAMAKAKQAERDAEARSQRQAREAASQPHKDAPAQPSGSRAAPLVSTENRPENWKGGTPQYGFGFTPGSPPDRYGNATPSMREHAPPQMPRSSHLMPLQGDHEKLNEAIKAQAAKQRAEKAAAATRQVIDSARQGTATPEMKQAAAHSASTRAKQASPDTRATFEVANKVTAPRPGYVAEPARERFSAGKEVTDRMAAKAARPVEMTDKQAKREALLAGARAQAARDRQSERER